MARVEDDELCGDLDIGARIATPEGKLRMDLGAFCGKLTRMLAAPVTGRMFGKGVHFSDVSTRVLKAFLRGDADYHRHRLCWTRRGAVLTWWLVSDVWVEC